MTAGNFINGMGLGRFPFPIAESALKTFVFHQLATDFTQN